MRERMAIALPAIDVSQREQMTSTGKRELGDTYDCTSEEGTPLSMEQVGLVF